MADRFPLILNTSANQIQEIASGDTLDLTDVNISNAGVITATSFAGDGSGLIGVASTDNIVTGTAATFNTFPIDINAGMDVAGVSTFAGNIDANGDLDVDGHTNLDNVSIAGVTTTLILHVNDIGRGTNNADVNIITEGTGKFTVHRDSELQHVYPETDSTYDLGKPSVRWKESYMDLLNSHDIIAIGATFSGNVSIGGTLTYEDVTNIDSVGIITARSDVKVGTGVTLTPAGAGFFSGIVTASSFKTPSGQALIHDQTATFGLIFPADDKLRIYQNGTHKFAFEFPTVSGFLRSRLYFNHSSDDNTYIDNVAADTIGITVGGTERLNINPTGINVTGVCTATSFVGDGSNLTGVGISTEQVTPSSNVATLDLSKDDHKIVASGTYTIDVSGGTEAENHVIRIENSGISTVGFSTYFKFPSGGTPALPTASGAISLISFTVHKVGSVGIATVLLAGASVNFS